MAILQLPQVSQLSLQGEQLSDLINGLPFSAHLRDVQTDKYILANQFQAKNRGFEKVDDIIGLTSEEVFYNNNIKKLSSLDASLTQLEEYHRLFRWANNEVEQKNCSINFEERNLIPTGFVFVGKIFKMPILGKNQKTVAVFTCAQETTKTVDLLDLYNLYKKNLPKKRAIEQFLKYLKIDEYFHSNPTDAEILILLVMRQTSAHKLIAYLLKVKPVTVESHIKRLRDKLKENLNHLLMILRNFSYERTTWSV